MARIKILYFENLRAKLTILVLFITIPHAFGDGGMGNACYGSEDFYYQPILFSQKEFTLTMAIIDGEPVSADAKISFPSHYGSGYDDDSLSKFQHFYVEDETLNASNDKIISLNLRGITSFYGLKQ